MRPARKWGAQADAFSSIQLANCCVGYEVPVTALLSQSCMPAMPVGTFDWRFGGRGWERRQTRHGEQELVRGIEEVQVGVDGTVGGGEEDGRVAGLVDGDVG